VLERHVEMKSERDVISHPRSCIIVCFPFYAWGDRDRGTLF
jgi:hypothetical protein